LGPLGTAATSRPIVPAPGDYNDGESGGIMIGRENQSTRRKRAPVTLCPGVQGKKGVNCSESIVC
jgi:hypothetical protein